MSRRRNAGDRGQLKTIVSPEMAAIRGVEAVALVLAVLLLTVVVAR